MKHPVRHLLAGLALSAICAGCATPRQIRQAQDSFNAASRLEVERRAEAGDPRASLLEDLAVSGSYRQTLAMLDQELKEHRDELFRDNLLGTALLLKALCHWRLADLEDSAADRKALDDTLSELRSGTSLGLGTRDRVLTRALTGLRDHDQGLRATAFDDASGAERFFCSAFSGLENALAEEKPPASHPIRDYVELAKVAAVREWIFAAQRFLATADADAKTLALEPCFYDTAAEFDDSGRAARDRLRDLATKVGFTWPLPAGQARDAAQDQTQCEALIRQTCPS